MAKPVELDYVPYQSNNFIEGKKKRFETTKHSITPSLNDLTNHSVYTSKLMTLFEEPIKRFIIKYHEIIDKKYANQRLKSSLIGEGKSEYGCQTSLLKPQ